MDEQYETRTLVCELTPSSWAGVGSSGSVSGGVARNGDR